MNTNAGNNSGKNKNEQERAERNKGSEEAFKSKPSTTREQDFPEHDSPSEERKLAAEDADAPVEVKS